MALLHSLIDGPKDEQKHHQKEGINFKALPYAIHNLCKPS